MRDAADALSDVLGPPSRLAAVHGARQRHLASRDVHLDLGGVHVGIVGQAVAHVLADALVGARVALRPAPAMVLRALVALQGVLLAAARRVVAPDPAGDLVARASEEAALPVAAVACGIAGPSAVVA